MIAMKKILVALTIILCSAALIPLQGQEKREFGSYKEMREYLGQLFDQKKYEEAAVLLESVLDRFPDNVLANTFNLAAARLYQGDADKTLQALEEGHGRGFFYGVWDFVDERWDPVRTSPRFEAFLKKNQARIDEAQKNASLKIEAAMPAGYNPARKYPLFILCPEVPTTIGDEDILAAKARGLRGTLLTTEADNRVERQRTLMDRMEKLCLPAVFHLTPGIGHWYPEDFETLLNGALGRIFDTGKSE
jgi:hypothetical protein